MKRSQSPLILFRGLSTIVNNPHDESRSSHEARPICDSAREKETRMAWWVTDILERGATCDTFGSSTDGRMLLKNRRARDVISSRSAYGHRKYVSRLVGETSFVHVSSLHFCAIHSRLIAPRWIETRLLEQVRSISQSIFHLVYRVHPSILQCANWCSFRRRVC